MPGISIETAAGTLPNLNNKEVLRASREGGRTEAVKDNASPAAASVDDSKFAKPEPEESAQAAVEKLQRYADRLDRNLEFSIDDSSGRTVVTVRDGSTEEVIRQIPSEEALRLASDMDNGGVRLIDAHA